MSGLEFIGLALALVPLFTDAIEHHNTIITPFKAISQATHKQWAEDFLGDLNFEICMLKLSLQKLIKELSISEALKAELLDLEHFNKTLWREPEPALQEALKSRLSDCADNFVKSLTTILRHLDKIVKDETLPVQLRGEDILIPETTSFRRLEQLMSGKGDKLVQRFRFGTKQDKRQKLLVKIGKHNTRLQKMLEHTSDTAPVNTVSTRTRSSDMPHSHLWNCMDGLRRAMRALCCQCDPHDVRFGLLKSTGNDENTISFDMLMKFAHDQSGGKFRWGESKIHIGLEENLPRRTRQVAFGEGDEPCGVEMMFRNHSLDNTITGSTVICSSSTTTLSSSPTAVGSTPLVVESPAGEQSYNNMRIEVTSLCETIKRGLKQKACSYIVYEDETLWHTTSPKRQETDESHPGVTLASLLEEQKKLTMKQKKILSVVLASSLLWYPWHDHDVDKESIHFHSRSVLDLTRPYTDLIVYEESTTEDPDAPFRICQNRSLLSLAIMLLEIELGQKIEEYYEEDDLTDGEPNVNTDFFTASRLLQENSDELYNGTREAIESCLQCEFGVKSTALNDFEFRQAAYEKIILPLEDVLSRGFNVTIEELGTCEPQPPQETKAKNVSIQRVPSPIAGAGAGAGAGIRDLFNRGAPSARNLPAIDTPSRQTRFAVM